jgi:hypothetical protein
MLNIVDSNFFASNLINVKKTRLFDCLSFNQFFTLEVIVLGSKALLPPLPNLLYFVETWQQYYQIFWRLVLLLLSLPIDAPMAIFHRLICDGCTQYLRLVARQLKLSSLSRTINCLNARDKVVRFLPTTFDGETLILIKCKNGSKNYFWLLTIAHFFILSDVR